MNPRLMLSLWRERWGKVAGTNLKVPYVHGKVNQWAYRLPYSGVWSVTGVPAFTLLLCTLLMFLMMSIDLSFNNQIGFSVLFVCIAVYVRRYAGTLITLVLVTMAVIASTRYLYWRFNATLVPDFSKDFLFSFCFFVAECYLALLVLIGLVQSIWPLKRTPVALPVGQGEWPAVDVFILCDDQPYAAIKLTAVAAGQLDWPIKKLKIYLVDGMQRDDLYALAASIGAHYLPHPDVSGNHAGFINQSLPSTNGEFIFVLESGQVPGRRFLQSTVGWFLSDQKLAVVQTPHHFLAPIPSQRDLEIVNSSGPARSCVLMRRSVVVQMGGVDTAEATQKSHMALRLQALGYGSAYIGFDRHEIVPNENHVQDAMVEPTSDTSTDMFLVEHPFAGRSLLWKQRITLFYRALQFYYPALRLLFFVAPVVYLMGHVQVIQTSPELFMAYVIPHFVHAYIARARTDGKNRFKLLMGIREIALAWYMLIPTTLTLLLTQFKQCLSGWSFDRSKNVCKAFDMGPKALFSPVNFLSYLFVLSLNLAGFFSGLLDMIFFSSRQWGVAALYLLWTSYNLMLLAAMLAIAQEANQILRHTSLQRHLTAMIKLPSGRTVACTTENFPSPVLEISLPMPVVVDAGAPVSLSIFHAHREVVFPAVVVTRRNLKLGVSIASTAQKDYRLFVTAVLSRGLDWPKWLPGRNADRPFPKWMTDAFIAVPIAVLDFITNINKYLHWARLDSWIQLWKKKR